MYTHCAGYENTNSGGGYPRIRPHFHKRETTIAGKVLHRFFPQDIEIVVVGEGCISGCKVLYPFLEKGWEGVGVKERGKGINEDGLDAFGEPGIGCFGCAKGFEGNSSRAG